MQIDTTGWPSAAELREKQNNAENAGEEQSCRRPCNAPHMYDHNKQVPVVPVTGFTRSSCEGCIARSAHPDRMVLCDTLPWCGSQIWVPATPDTLAQYMAERMTHD